MVTEIILAAIAMVIQDIFGVLMTQAEARNHPWLTGFFDSIGWIAAIWTTTISVTILQGHSLVEKGWVILAITIANFAGSWVGVKLGKKYVKVDLDDFKQLPAQEII